MAYPSPRQLQLRRGNAAAVGSYTGLAGELTVNTTDWTLQVHDGSTVGGHAATVNTSTLTDQISSVNANITIANVGMKGYVDQGNTIQSAAITSSNVGMRGYVDATIAANIANIAVASTYSNVNVRSYLNSVNIAPYSNVNVASYLTAQNITSYGNTQVAQLLNTVANVNAVLVANVTAGAGSISPGTSGNVLTSNGTNWVSGAVFIRTVPTTVANLVLANVAGAGARAFVTDANTIVFGSAITGGFGNSIPVYSTGNNWQVG